MRKKYPREIIHDNRENRKWRDTSHLIWLHDVRSAFNVGSIFRIADALGATEVLLSGFTPIPPSEKITKTALGAEESVKWSHFNEASEVIDYLTQLHIQLIALEQTTKSISIQHLNREDIKTNRVCLVAGSETVGVSEDILAVSDVHIHIDQFGEKHSLNISVAVGIATFFIDRLLHGQSLK